VNPHAGLQPEHRVRRQGFLQDLVNERQGRLFRQWLGENGRILDLGCWDGALARHYAAGNDVIGLDLGLAALRLAAQVPGIRAVQAPLSGPLPFPDECFDAAVLADAAEHLPWLALILAEAHRVLRPEGLLVGSVPLACHLPDRRFTYSDFHALLARRFRLEVLISGQLGVGSTAFRCRKM